MNRFKALYYAYLANPQDGPVAVIQERGSLIQYFNNGGAAYRALKTKSPGYKTVVGGRLFGNLHQLVFSND